MASTSAANLSLPRQSSKESFPLTYEISKRSKSQWAQKNADPRRQPKVINSSKIMDLAMKSRYRAGDRIGNVEIMYVPGAPTIFVNDYIDLDGNVQPGLKKLYGADLEKEHYARAVKKGVCFVDGMLFLENFGGKDDRLLCEFVYHHALNESAPNYKPQRDINSSLLFKEFAPEKKAEFALESFDKDAEGYALYHSLRSKDGKYQTAKINAILGIFSIGGDLGAEDNAQKLQLLAPIVKHSPAKFLEIHDDHITKCKTATAMAIELGVLTINSDAIRLRIGEGLETIASIEDKVTDSQKVEELIYHFLGTHEGRRQYSMMVGETEGQKFALLSQENKAKKTGGKK